MSTKTEASQKGEFWATKKRRKIHFLIFTYSHGVFKKKISLNECVYMHMLYINTHTVGKTLIFKLMRYFRALLLSAFVRYLSNSKPFPDALQGSLCWEEGPVQSEPTCQRAEASVKGSRQLPPCESWLSGRWLPEWTENCPPSAWGLACDSKWCPRSPTAKKKKPKPALRRHFPSRTWKAQGVYGQPIGGWWIIKDAKSDHWFCTQPFSYSGESLMHWVFFLKISLVKGCFWPKHRGKFTRGG